MTFTEQEHIDALIDLIQSLKKDGDDKGAEAIRQACVKIWGPKNET